MKNFTATEVADFIEALLKVSDEMNSLWSFKGGRMVVENGNGQRMSAWWDPDSAEWMLGEE